MPHPFRGYSSLVARAVLVLTGVGALVCSLSADSPSFPGFREAWPTATPESQGVSPELLKQARSRMRTDAGVPFESVDLILIRNGFDIWHLGDPYRIRQGLHLQRDWASCGRSLMTTFFGMMLKENGQSVSVMEKPVRDVFHSYTARALDPAILGKHLLGYTACGDPPGSRWDYACHYFTMYKIVRDRDGQNPAKRLERLAAQIDADWQAYEYWGHGQDVPFLSITASEQEAARWGYLWLHEGNWRGRQIVDREFVTLSLQPIVSPLGGFAHSNEGLQIHLNLNGMWGNRIPADAYAAFGAGGKIIFVCPSLNVVAAITTQPGPYERREVNGEIHRSIQNLMEPIIEAVIR